MQIKIRLTHGQTETSTAVAVLDKTFWGAVPPSAEWGAIISSQWKNWGAWTKNEGAKAPGLEPPLQYRPRCCG